MKCDPRVPERVDVSDLFEQGSGEFAVGRESENLRVRWFDGIGVR